jgi:iron complex transport system permease protein
VSRSAAPGLLIALAALAAGLLVAFTVGRFPITVAELMDVLWSRLTGRASSVSPAAQNVILLVRGPRVVAAILVGAALSVAGTAFQGLFRNPLVSPDILGASSGAALGTVLGIFFSLGVIGIEGLAFAGGLLRSPPSMSLARSCSLAIRCLSWCSPALSSAHCLVPASAWSNTWPTLTTSCLP